MKAVFVGGRYNGVEIDVDEIFTTDGMWNGGFRPNYSDIRAKGGLEYGYCNWAVRMADDE